MDEEKGSGFNHVSQHELPKTPIHSKRRIGRRLFLKGAAAVASGAVLAPDLVAKAVFAPTPVSPERQQSIEQKESVVDRIKKKKEELGDQLLTFEHAEEISDMAAQLYTQNVNSSFSAADIMGDFYIVEGKEDEERGLYTFSYNSPAVLRLKERYPNALLSPEEEVMIHGDTLGGITKAFVSDSNNIFAYLESHNGKTTFSSLLSPSKDYLETSERTTQLPGTIFTTFLTNSLHEMVHHEKASFEKKPLERELADPLIDIVLSRNPLLTKEDIVSCTKSGFAVSVTDKKGKSYYFNGLEELTASYGAEQILKKNGLAYSRIEGLGRQRSAFDYILLSVGLSEEEVLRYHKNFQVKEMLIRIAKIAKGIDQDDEAAKIKFGVQFLADITIDITNSTEDWPEKYKKQYLTLAD